MVKKLLIIIIVLGIVGVGVWYWKSQIPSGSENSPTATSSATGAGDTSLGATIYEKTQNPIGDKIPTTTSPTANPLEGAYKNPFE